MYTEFQKHRRHEDRRTFWVVFWFAFGSVGGGVGIGILSVILGWN